MKKICAFALIISAIYWMAPSERFNIVTAADYSTGKSAATPSVNVSEKAAISAHAYMTESYLNASLQFLNGLEKQVKADVPLNDAVVATHLKMYDRGIVGNLQQAKVHNGELQGVVTRAPASEPKVGDQLTKTSATIDRAIGLSQDLGSRLSGTISDKSALRDSIDRVRDQIRTALKEQKDLNSKFGV